MSIKESTNENQRWDMILSPKRGWFDIHLNDLWSYRDLIQLFVWRDFVAAYKQTILGPIWIIIGPIVSAIVYTVIFGNIAKLPTDGLPSFLFYLAGNSVWGYFSTCLVSTSNTFVNNSGIFGKVYFPRLTVPISVVISNLISFGLRFGVFMAFWIYFLLSGSNIHPTWWILFLPILLFLMAGLGLGFGIIVSSLTTKYRDMQQLVGMVMQLLMYATPIIYPLSTVEGIWRWLILANPMTSIVEIYRLAFLGTSGINPIWLIYTTCFTFIVLSTGIILFNHTDASFMDTV